MTTLKKFVPLLLILINSGLQLTQTLITQNSISISYIGLTQTSLLVPTTSLLLTIFVNIANSNTKQLLALQFCAYNNSTALYQYSAKASHTTQEDALECKHNPTLILSPQILFNQHKHKIAVT